MPLSFAANISFLFADLPWDQRLAAAAHCGFAAIELNPPLPYQVSPAAFARMLGDEGLHCPLIVAPVGDGPTAFGHACVPGAQAGFRESMMRALDYAAAVNLPLVHPSAGVTPAGIPRAEAEATYVDNIAWAAEQVAVAGRRLCIEPVCEFRTPGFFLQTTDQALDLIGRSGRPEIGLIFDVFHVEKQQGPATAVLPGLLSNIVHVQVSDTPNRHRPGLGSIDLKTIFRLLERAGYGGWIGCEYVPELGRSHDLDWAAPWTDRPLGGGLAAGESKGGSQGG